MSLRFIDQDILILHLKQLFSFWGVLYTAEKDITSGLGGDQVVVSRIRDFEGLIPIMQECGKAMFDITQNDTKIISASGGRAWTGVAWTQAQERMATYRQSIAEIATNLELIK